ncbi:DUF968 domain-containing protein [Salinicola lusitanus]|uniref:DUF968 domain-containing protein n=1 Tax=Salinicola lusitanus TaxID=1949085 RepID=UPI000DA1E78D|nr:DUF968 domain-containing protein [Salinicola lusitanus]
MRRSELKRKTPLATRKPMHRQSPRRREASPKPCKPDTRFRSPAYLRWVRSMPCCVCLCDATDAHHVIGLGWGLSGMGMKAPDSYCIPCCRECHGDIHRDPELQRHQPDWLLQIIDYGLREFPLGDIHTALIEARTFVLSKREGSQ